MSVFDYLTPGEAAQKILRPGNEGSGIRGLRVADADWCSRTATGNARVPEHTWEARRYLDRFKVLVRMERLTEDADPGTYELHFADGTSSYLHRQDLLCVERQILKVHYGESRSACGDLGEYETCSTHLDAVTCKNCTAVANATV